MPFLYLQALSWKIQTHIQACFTMHPDHICHNLMWHCQPFLGKLCGSTLKNEVSCDLVPNERVFVHFTVDWNANQFTFGLLQADLPEWVIQQGGWSYWCWWFLHAGEYLLQREQANWPMRCPWLAISNCTNLSFCFSLCLHFVTVSFKKWYFLLLYENGRKT